MVSPIARCSCSGQTCNCLIVGGSGVLVAGSGTPANPYTVSLEAPDFGDVFRVNDTATLNLTLVGAGTADDPLILSGVATPRLLDLADVDDDSGPLNGEVPVWVGGGSGHWEFQAPPANPGAVNVSVGLDGDGSFGDPLVVRTSGVWGVGELADLGSDTTIGLSIYEDENGELRAEPPVLEDVSLTWSAITGKPTSFPSVWEMVTGKPTTFPPQIGTTSATAAAGNHTHTWASISGKPTTFPSSWSAITDKPPTFTPSTHTHTTSQITNLPLISVADQAGANRIPVYNSAGQLTTSNPTLSGHTASKAYVDAATAGALANGPTSAAYSRSATGSGWFAVWMNSSLQFMRNTSSLRYKENIRDWGGGIEAVLGLRPVIFDRKGEDTPDDEVGFIAEEVVEVLPEAVTYYDGEIDGLNDRPIIAALVAAVQSQQSAIEDLRRQVATMGGVA